MVVQLRAGHRGRVEEHRLGLTLRRELTGDLVGLVVGLRLVLTADGRRHDDSGKGRQILLSDGVDRRSRGDEDRVPAAQACVAQCLGDGRGEDRSARLRPARGGDPRPDEPEGFGEAVLQLRVVGTAWIADLDVDYAAGPCLGEQAAHGRSARAEGCRDLGLRRILQVIEGRRPHEEVVGEAQSPALLGLRHVPPLLVPLTRCRPRLCRLRQVQGGPNSTTSPGNHRAKVLNKRSGQLCGDVLGARRQLPPGGGSDHQ